MGARDRAVKTMLSESRRLFAKCCWCHTRCVWWQKLPKDSILSTIKNGCPPRIIRFVYEGEIMTMPIVTVDHVVELRNNGTSRRANLVLSCRTCNGKRSAQQPENKYPNCVQCGKPRIGKGKGRRRCPECVRVNKAARLSAETN